jgi:drug/metabolite transporter (DMT)-like permease
MHKTLAHLGLFTVALIYGANYVIAKGIMQDGMIEPFAFILCRCIAGVLLFWLVGIFFVSEPIRREDLPTLVLSGALGVAINQLCFFSGLAITSPIHSSLIMIMTPILIIVLSALLYKEVIPKKRVVGVLLGFVGAALLVLAGGASSAASSIRGDLLIFVNASSYGCYLLVIKNLMSKYHPLTIIKWAYTFGLFFVTPFGIGQLFETDFATFSDQHWFAFGYVLLFTTFLAYLLNALALKHVAPSVVGSYIYLQPVLAVIIAWYTGMDHITTLMFVAATLIFAGVYLASNAPKIKQRAASRAEAKTRS